MKSFLIAVNDTKILLKDRKAILTMILMPIILTAILGSALKGVMGGEGMPETILGVYSPDVNLMTETIIQTLGAEELAITFEQAQSEEQLMEWLDNRDIHVGLIVPKEWDPVGVERLVVLPVTGQEANATLIQQMIETFAQMSQAIETSTKTVMTEAAVMAASGREMDMEAIQFELMESVDKVVNEQKSYISEPAKKETVSSTQYYAAAMAAMFLLFNAGRGAKSFHRERNTGTLSRLMMTPASVRSILIGKFIGTLLYAWVQFLTFMTATHFLLKVEWGSGLSIIQVLFIAFFYSFAVAGLSMTVAAFTKDEKIADTIGSMGVQILSLLGGSMLPLVVFPEALRKIAMLLPNSWALTSFTSIMTGTTWSALWLPAGILFGVGVLSIFVSSLKLRAV